MATVNNLDILKIGIERALKEVIESSIKEQISMAQEKVEKDIRNKTAGIVAQLFNHIDYIKNNDRLIITVKFDKL